MCKSLKQLTGSGVKKLRHHSSSPVYRYQSINRRNCEPGEEDSLLDDFFQKLTDEDESIEDLPKYILETVYNKLLEREMEKHLQAKKYERTDERSGHRNGYRERNLHTRVGTLELRVPRYREGKFSPEIFDKY